MHWNVAGKPLHGSTFRVTDELDDPKCFWATEAEFYLNTTDPANYAKLPASTYHTWDLKALTEEGGSLPPAWTTHGAPASRFGPPGTVSSWGPRKSCDCGSLWKLCLRPSARMLSYW
jgi:hypothetical protein